MASKERKDNAKPADKALTLMRKRYRQGRDALNPLYTKAQDDIRFVTIHGEGVTWDDAMGANRENEPCYEFPKLNLQVTGIVNELKQIRPSGKIRPVENGDQNLAEVLQGICLNIQSVSRAERAYDVSTDMAVKGGYGAWHICTEYANDDDFDQDIRIKMVRNPFAITWDPAAVEIDKRDGRWLIYEELIPKDQYEEEHPNIPLGDFFDDSDCVDWHEKGQVRRAQYWYKEAQTTELWEIASANGTAVVYKDECPLDESQLAEAGLQIVKRRPIKHDRVFMRLTNGRDWLSEPYPFPSKFIPFVPQYGNVAWIDGNEYFFGAVRPAKDGQRLHNYHYTKLIELVSMSPLAPFVVTKDQIEGLENLWNTANTRRRPYLVVNNTADKLPTRSPPPDIPVALLQLGNLDNENMKAATGQYDASLGARSNETSGRAINARKAQSSNASFQYLDNLTSAIEYTYEILIDMIPRVYDTQRVVRVLGEDGGTKWATLYQEVMIPGADKPIVLNDISKAKCDVVVTPGPAYATARMEAVEQFTALAAQVGGTVPGLAPILTYQVLLNMDLPGTDEAKAAVRKQLVASGLLPPKDGEQQPAPQPPPPQVMAQLQKIAADTQKSQAEAVKTMAEAQTIMPEANAKLAQLQAQTQEQQLQNAVSVRQIASEILQSVPIGPPPTLIDNQPPNGGFFVPGTDATAAA